jgi:hypothetical protein
LADANPATYLPTLAMSVNNLAIRLAEVNCDAEAAASRAEAAELRARLDGPE